LLFECTSAIAEDAAISNCRVPRRLVTVDFRAPDKCNYSLTYLHHTAKRTSDHISCHPPDNRHNSDVVPGVERKRHARFTVVF